MRYFAYGSNLLSARITARCPSARAIGAGFAKGYMLEFTKRSIDGSGKATLAPSAQSAVHGVVFDIADIELPALDIAESGYERLDNFAVDGFDQCAVTYIARAASPGLAPYDWYLALVIAGANEHALDAAYIKWLRAHPYHEDVRDECGFRNEAHLALMTSGYHTVGDALVGTD